jgi:GNAT superfamily N-acetyltransferase
MIRHAGIEDVPALVAMGGEFIASAAYAGRLGDSAEARASLMCKLIHEPEGLLLVLDRDGPRGMLGMILYPHPISGETVAGELFWWVDPAHRGRGVALLTRAEAWAREHGAVKVQMIAPNDRVARLYQARGYAPLEQVLQKELV